MTLARRGSERRRGSEASWERPSREGAPELHQVCMVRGLIALRQAGSKAQLLNAVVAAFASRNTRWSCLAISYTSGFGATGLRRVFF